MACKNNFKISVILGLSLISLKQLSHISLILGNIPVVAGFCPSSVTFCIIWKALSPGHSTFSVSVIVVTAPNAYTSHSGQLNSDLSCSGGWNPGEPANIVLVPIELVWVMILANPKSVKTLCRVAVSTYKHINIIGLCVSTIIIGKHHWQAKQTYHYVGWFNI